MTDLDHIEALLKHNRMPKKHEIHGYPNGWNGAFDWLAGEVEKLKTSRCPHGFSKAGYCSECNRD